MKTKMVNMMLALLLISAAGVPAAMAAVPVPVPEPMPVMEDSPDMNFSKLQISPRHYGMDLMPGESDKITVTVKNPNNETVSVVPTVKDQPYSDYILDEAWVTITPVSAELEPDTEEEFTIEIEIPDDAERGQYSLQVAFTDDVMPTPYPSPYPMYINALDLHISVWKPPVIQIQPSYIYDRVESGKGYDYQINLKNIGEKEIEIDPKLGGERWYGFDMGMVAAFENDAITIDAPSVVPAGGTATVNMHLSVPAGAKGGYEGGLDLNIKDPSIDEWNGMIHLSFEVWTQPTEPYVKTFAVGSSEPITIEITSQQYGHYTCGGGSGGSEDEDPSFDVTLKESSGDYVTLTRTMAAYSGSVNLGGSDCTPPWEMDSSGMYDEGRTSYVERYTADGAVGTWKLCILPHYVEEFEYAVMIGDAG
uniref:NPCBM-associated, NEW3 domain of alpha-galactosidase n=1 Tax=Candidatus Methanogaster sp. ANME-2c ERB4 TaxID=2759911 RepID=A0A7G9YH51_9EURY|nr:hypothetical protein LNGCCOLK_00012 [Methanosarcinales archaeon ANME-2c ERB4]